MKPVGLNVSMQTGAMPKWLRVCVKIYAALICSNTLLTLVYAASAMRALDKEDIGTLFFSLPLALGIVGGFLVCASALVIIFSIGFFFFKRWSVPLFYAQVVGLSFFFLALVMGGRSNMAAILMYGIFTALVWVMMIGILRYQNAFVGAMRKLWIQIPIFALILLGSAISTLSIMYVDDLMVNDSDLVLPTVAMVAESDNAYYVLPSEQTLSVTEKESLNAIGEHYTLLQAKEPMDIEKIAVLNTTLKPVTQAFIEASQKTHYQCPSTVNKYGAEEVPCSISEMRAIAQALAVRSYIELYQGDTDAALQSARALLRFGKVMDSGQPSIIEHLVAVSFTTMGLDAIARITEISSLSQKSAAALVQELDSYALDGSVLAKALRREYMTTKQYLQSFKWLSGYFWHQNATQNAVADIMRKKIAIAQTSCGEALEEKIRVSHLTIEQESNISFTTILKPNGIGRIVHSLISISSNDFRTKECKVNEMREALTHRLLSREE